MPTLHPQIVQVLDAMARAELRPIEAMTPAEARAQMEATARARKAEPLPVARIEERMIPRPAGARIRLGGFTRPTPTLRRPPRRSSITMAAAMSSAASTPTI